MNVKQKKEISDAKYVGNSLKKDHEQEEILKISQDICIKLNQCALCRYFEPL